MGENTTMIKSIRLNLSFSIIFLLIYILSTACFATKQDVKQAVDESNKAIASTIAYNTAALIPDSELSLQPNQNNTTWQKSIEQMDLIIANNPDQDILINHLRVRQAMLLTIYRQDNFAREKWQLVDVNKLTTERDNKLYENYDTLVWWYKRAPNSQTLSNAEIALAANSIREMNNSISSTENHDLKIYLAAIRAQIALRVSRDTSSSDRVELIDKQHKLISDLESFVVAFDNEEQEWLQQNPSLESADTLPVYELRNIFWLSNTINRYFSYETGIQNTSTTRGYNIPNTVWRPDWINGISNNVACK